MKRTVVIAALAFALGFHASASEVDVLVAFDNGAQAYVANKGVTLTEFATAQIGKMNDVLVTNQTRRTISISAPLRSRRRLRARSFSASSTSRTSAARALPAITIRTSMSFWTIRRSLCRRNARTAGLRRMWISPTEPTRSPSSSRSALR